MPTYQYACTECGHRLEAVQSFADEPLTECPSCQGRLRKLFNSVGIVFKGSGFYRTDSRKGADSSSSSTVAESSGTTPSKTESTTASGSTSSTSGSPAAKPAAASSSTSSSSTASSSTSSGS